MHAKRVRKRALSISSSSRAKSRPGATLGSTTPKWSAPKRATRLASPLFCASHSPTCFRSASPAGRPRLSLTFLNRSRSISNTAILCRPPASPRRYCPTRSRNRLRFAKPGQFIIVGEIVEALLLADVIDRERDVADQFRTAGVISSSLKKLASSAYSVSTPTAATSDNHG